MRLNFPRRRVLAAAAAVAVAFSVSACGGGPQEAKTPGGYTVTLVNPDKLTVCTNLPYVPFQFEEDGEVVGFDVDIVNLAAEELGLEQEIIDIKFDSIESGAALTGNKCDLAAAGMTITPEREKNLTFSEPYFDEAIAFMTPKGEAVESIQDVIDGELKLGVQASTTSLQFAQDNGLTPQEYEDSGKQLQALQSGTVDVILQDLPVIQEWLKKPEIAEKFELGGTIETGSQYGLGFKKDADQVLVDVVNKAIKDAKAGDAYAEIYKKWFGTEPAAS